MGEGEEVGGREVHGSAGLRPAGNAGNERAGPRGHRSVGRRDAETRRRAADCDHVGTIKRTAGICSHVARQRFVVPDQPEAIGSLSRKLSRRGQG